MEIRLRAKFKAIGAATMLLTIVACNSDKAFVSFDTSFNNTSSGYINSALLQKGTLILVDTKAKTIQQIEIIDMSGWPEATSKSPTSKTATNFEGFTTTVSGVKLSGAKLSSLTASFGQEINLKLTKFTQEQLMSPYEFIAYIIRNTDTETLREKWLLDETLNSEDKFYILVSGTISVESASFYIGSQDAEDGITVRVGDVEVKAIIKAASSENWEGAGTPAIVKFYPFKMLKEKSGRITSKGITVPDNFVEILRRGS